MHLNKNQKKRTKINCLPVFKLGYFQSLKVMSAFQLNFRIMFAKNVKLFKIGHDACISSASKLTCSLSLSVLNTSRQESRNSVQQTLPSQPSATKRGKIESNILVNVGL